MRPNNRYTFDGAPLDRLGDSLKQSTAAKHTSFRHTSGALIILH